MKHYSRFFQIPKQPDNSPEQNAKEVDKEIANIATFIKTGLFTLSIILLSGIAIVQSQINKTEQSDTTATTSMIHNKKLPIYCVDRKDKVVALSFDAAWGAWLLLESLETGGMLS